MRERGSRRVVEAGAFGDHKPRPLLLGSQSGPTNGRRRCLSGSSQSAGQMCACSVLALAGLFLGRAGTEGLPLGSCMRLVWTEAAGGVGRVPATPFSSQALTPQSRGRRVGSTYHSSNKSPRTLRKAAPLPPAGNNENELVIFLNGHIFWLTQTLLEIVLVRTQ